MNKRTILAFALALALGGLLGACSLLEVGTLEFRSLSVFSVTEQRTDKGLSLAVSGQSADSGVGVRRVIVVTHGDRLTVLVRLELAHQGATGSFYHTFDIPPNIRRVEFGEEGVEIWPSMPERQPRPFPLPPSVQRRMSGHVNGR